MHKLLGFFFVYNLFFGFCYSQNQGVKREKGFHFNLQTFAMSYRFDEYWIVGLGSGFEQINQPDISYIPVYLSLRSSIGGDKIEAPIFRLDVGTHFGDLAKNGALLRAGIGYRLPIYKELCLNLEGIITYQGIRKEFESHPDVIQYYNMYGFGIGVGLEL